MYIESAEGLLCRRQRELKDLQDRLDELKRFKLSPAEVFVTRTQELAKQHAQSPAHRAGIQTRLQRLESKAV